MALMSEPLQHVSERTDSICSSLRSGCKFVQSRNFLKVQADRFLFKGYNPEPLRNWLLSLPQMDSRFSEPQIDALLSQWEEIKGRNPVEVLAEIPCSQAADQWHNTKRLEEILALPVPPVLRSTGLALFAYTSELCDPDMTSSEHQIHQVLREGACSVGSHLGDWRRSSGSKMLGGAWKEGAREWRRPEGC